MTDASGITTDVYDPFNELVSTTKGAGQGVSYTYDLDGNDTSITYPLGSGATWASTDTVNMAYNRDDQLQSVTDFNGHTSTLSYTSDGLPSSLALGASGDTITNSYSLSDSVSTIGLASGSTSLAQLNYIDTSAGGISSEVDTPSTAFTSASYAYTPQGRVLGYTPTPGSASTYAQDTSGNLTTLPTGAAATYDNASELTSSTLSGTTTSYSYDAAGNRLGSSVSGTAISAAIYNGANQLIYYHDTFGGTSEYMTMQYNGLGLRTGTSLTNSSGTTYQGYVWSNVQSVPQLLEDSTNAYIYGGKSATPFEQVNLSTGAISFTFADLLGSTRGEVSLGGSLTATTSYDAWGNPSSSGGLSSYSPFAYDGSYKDPTGLVYLINRYYEPTTGQFVSVDPSVSSTRTPYVFTDDNPVNAIDPTGKHESICVIPGLWGCILSVPIPHLIDSVSWGPPYRDGNQNAGLTLTVHPSAFSTGISVGSYFISPDGLASEAWAETLTLAAKAPSSSPAAKANTPSMWVQFECHWDVVRLRDPGRGFHLQTWYPSTNLVTEIYYYCNFGAPGQSVL